MEKIYRDIWIVSSDAKRADFIKSIIPQPVNTDEGLRFTVFDTSSAALAKMESIYYRRERKPDLVITDETLNRHKNKNSTKETGVGKVIADDANSRKVPAIILPQNTDLSSEDFIKKFKENVNEALLKNKFFGLVNRREENLVSR